MNCVFFVAYWSGQVNIYLLYNLAENVTACPKAGLHDGVSVVYIICLRRDSFVAVTIVKVLSSCLKALLRSEKR